MHFTGDIDSDGIVDIIDAQIGIFGGLCVEPEIPNYIPPIAISDIFYSDFETAIYFSPTLNDFDTDGRIDSSTFSFVTTPPLSEGNALFNASNGTIYFVPALGFQGQTSFQYTVEDNDSQISNVSTVTIIVGNPGTIVTGPDIRFTTKNTPIDIDIIQNDYSLISELDTSSITLLSSPPNGSNSLMPSGHVIYTPNNEFVGIDNYLYEVADKDGVKSNPTRVEILVSDSSISLVLALDDVFRLSKTITVNIIENDRSYPASIMANTVSIIEPPLHGSININLDGTIDYSADPLFNGTDFFKYSVMDDEGNLSNTANVILVVNLDTDSDGVPDIIDIDDDNDGILDEIEIAAALNDGDSDHDGVPDHLDLDSDNDGTNDVFENELTDLNKDGRADGAVDGDGLVSSVTGLEPLFDTDSDGIPDFIDLDSDGDGVYDIIESGHVLYLDINSDGRLDGDDTDRDGIFDLADNIASIWGDITDFTVINSDDDNFYNIKDPDDDNDGILTINEDQNENGNWEDDDTDGDSIVDYLDPDPFVILNIRGFLQGPSVDNSVLMRDDLRSKNFLPHTEPYTSLGYSFSGGGGETVDSGVFDVTGSDAIVDWVVVEIRSSGNNTVMNFSCAALIQRDGDIVGMDGKSPLIIFNRNHGIYNVGLKHRNHLGVMTGVAVGLSNRVLDLDFTSIYIDAWTRESSDTNHPMIELGNGKKALWAGNVDFNDKVLFQGGIVDPAPILNDVFNDPKNTEFLANFILIGYHRGDVNMDGKAVFQGSPNDTDLIFFNTIGHPENGNLNANFIILEHLPAISEIE